MTLVGEVDELGARALAEHWLCAGGTARGRAPSVVVTPGAALGARAH